MTEIQKRLPGKSATIDEVERVIRESDERGLVHQLITAPRDDYFYVICNCCPCCCVMLRSAIEYELGNTAIASNFEVLRDSSKCVSCGNCVDSCHFKALEMTDEILQVDKSKCVGCGLCIPRCQENALKLTRRV